ncbi:coagulation factor X-like isoform X1 [Arapaima gigas]
MLCVVFLEKINAVQVLRIRKPRGNFFLEEVMPGNLERECYEEICSQEEAFEIFQTKEKTMEFWYRYKNLNVCQKNPCMNGGICSVDRNDFVCLCPPQYEGKMCEIEVFECQYKNGGCLQYCTNKGRTAHVECSCAEGYQLQEDGKTCEPTVPFPCGKKWQATFTYRSLLDDHLLNESDPDMLSTPSPPLSNYTNNGENSTEDVLLQTLDGQNEKRILGGMLEKQGGSPWQILIHREDGSGFCGGTLLSPRWVVSAAHCFERTPHHVTIGDYDKMRPDEKEQCIRVEFVLKHPHYHEYTYDSDIALLYLAQPVQLGAFAIPVCLPNAHLAELLLRESNMGTVTGWGAMQYLGLSSRFLRKVDLPVVDQKKCIQSTEQVITDNMFCAGYLDKQMDACSGDSGGPFVTHYRGTWYLTGIISWGEGCGTNGKYGVYTRVENFLTWIQETIHEHEQNLAV